MAKQVRWVGEPPAACDVCNAPIITEFVDGQTTMGPWANMCTGCHRKVGVGLGTGRGQKFVKGLDGRFTKSQG